MAIVAADILIKLSIVTGAAGDSAAQGDPNASLGKYISQTALAGTALNNLWDNITGDENAASDVEYRCIFVHNNHATLTLLAPVAWIVSEVAGGASVALSVDTTAESAKASATAQAKQVANESTAPATQTFSAPTTKAAGLALGDIPAGHVKAIWIRRTAANTGALDNDGATLRVEGDTGA
jgi:hypothetical protein